MGIVMLAAIIIVLTCVVCVCKNHERKAVKLHRNGGASNADFKDIQL